MKMSSKFLPKSYLLLSLSATSSTRMETHTMSFAILTQLLFSSESVFWSGSSKGEWSDNICLWSPGLNTLSNGKVVSHRPGELAGNTTAEMYLGQAGSVWCSVLLSTTVVQNPHIGANSIFIFKRSYLTMLPNSKRCSFLECKHC